MGVTLVDAGVVIGFLDSADAHHDAAHRALAEALRRGDRLVIPASALAEALVGPSRHGARSVATVRDLIARVPFEISPLDESVAIVAAELRTRHKSLKLPDALVIATAIVRDADVVLTTDRRWPVKSRLGLRGAVTEL
jgi:predicted nucleic acid-binding protein